MLWRQPLTTIQRLPQHIEVAPPCPEEPSTPPCRDRDTLHLVRLPRSADRESADLSLVVARRTPYAASGVVVPSSSLQHHVSPRSRAAYEPIGLGLIAS
jgi:hypothetical protein